MNGRLPSSHKGSRPLSLLWLFPLPPHLLLLTLPLLFLPLVVVTMGRHHLVAPPLFLLPAMVMWEMPGDPRSDLHLAGWR